jgi:prepilin-type N-terminal cleavage/methylation domain-containing protein
MQYIKSKNGFTLIELSLVIALFIVVLSLAVPYGLRFFRIERLDGISRDILSNLRLSQSQAISQKQDSDFGIYIGNRSFVTFIGSSYATREVLYDQIFNFSDQVIISGLSEIVFYRLTGLPSNSGEIRLEGEDRTNIITINQQGIISLKVGVSLENP